MSVLSRLPLLVVLMLFASVAMFVPSGYALVLHEYHIARAFLHSGLIFLILGGMIGLAVSANPAGSRIRGTLMAMLGAVTILPLMMAVPFAESLPDTGLLNAWWEMVSSLTTTGATLYAADLLAPPLHLWRAMVGWMGGLFILVSAIAILAPLRVGGFEIISSPYGRSVQFDKLSLQTADGQRPHLMQPGQGLALPDPTQRLIRSGARVLPVYGGLTLVLWVVLMMLGDPSLVALCRAMGTLSTSGIAPVAGPAGQFSGVGGEMVIFLFFIPALSRRFWPGGGELKATENIRHDPELRLGMAIVAMVSLVLFGRHFLGAIEVGTAAPGPSGSFLAPLRDAAAAAWGGLFNALSYLTTTGWNSVDWQGARSWSGFSSPGLLLAGLAMMGGGVATTAGGVKLLRVYALARHGERELERMIHPHSIAGGGRIARRLRREGAYLAFIFFMLFACSIAVTVALVSIHQIEFESATILSIAALTNTGQLAGTIPLTPSFQGSAGIAGAPWDGWAGLPDFTKAVLAATMIVGRLETLAILALFSPDFWRR